MCNISLEAYKHEVLKLNTITFYLVQHCVYLLGIFAILWWNWKISHFILLSLSLPSFLFHLMSPSLPLPLSRPIPRFLYGTNTMHILLRYFNPWLDHIQIYNDYNECLASYRSVWDHFTSEYSILHSGQIISVYFTNNVDIAVAYFDF